MSASPTLRDQLAADAHQAWMDENLRNDITTRLSSLTGEEQMVPFDRLSDPVKAYDYALVDVILDSLARRGYQVTKAIGIDAVALLMGAIPLPPSRGPGVFSVRGPNGELPDTTGTPGATNPDVTDDPAVLKVTIGTPGWTAKVRPPVAYTNALKVQVMAEYGLTGDPASFELDHLVPLCAGGNPTSQQNLWAQRRTGINGASVKDLTEVAAQHAILSGAMSLSDVQAGFMQDWTKLHDALFRNPTVVGSLLATAMAPPELEP
jgi:hypothetical protein